jgi:3-hydroxybutyrate dehydrogenase
MKKAPAEVAALNALGQGRLHGADMSKPSEIEAMMQFASSEFGQVDILVNNAGIPARGPASNPVENGTRFWPSILSSAHATRLALLAMQKAHAMVSRIINVASAHGWSRPLKNQPMSPPARSGRADQSHCLEKRHQRRDL